MKKVKYIIGVVVAAFAISSCVGDLNVTPIDPNANTADKALTSKADFQSFLAGVYTGYATSGFYGANGGPSISGLDGGASQYLRGMYHLSELTTDESVVGWNDQTIKSFHWMNWTVDDTFIYAIYSRIFFQISMANEFIRELKSTNVEFSEKEEFIAEARALRAWSYLHAIDNFGNVPFADENAVVGQFPDQMSRTDLFNWLETELKDIIDNSALPAARKNEYGRIDKGGAKFILAKLYLNAEVYTGTARWADCAKVLSSLLADGYALHTSSAGNYSAYQELFLADNDRCTEEIIFAIEQDGVATTSYGATNYIIFASTGGEMDPAAIGISSGWGGLRTTPDFYDKFSADDARNLFYTATQQKEIDDIGDFTNGYAFMKFLNRTSDGGTGKELGFVDTDFPVMRYADVLLMVAECEKRGASVSGMSGLEAINAVRSRAGVPAYKDYTLQDVLDERGRELYQELWRRQDLIRFGQFTTGEYIWQWKGNPNGKEGNSVDSYRNLFPIPASDMLANSKLTQNPGY